MKTLLITGPVGSGKSAVSRTLRALGMPVYDCDEGAKTLYARHPELVEVLEKELGTGLRKAGGVLDKPVLASLIFHDAKTRVRVNALVHPAVVRDFEAWKKGQGNVPWVGVESALFLSPEAGASLPCEAVLYVDAPEDIRLQRILQRDGCSEEQARRRMASQRLSPEDQRVTDVLLNDVDEVALQEKTKQFYHRLYEN